MFKTNQNKKNDLGKFLSWILRHGALKEGIPIGIDGFVSVNNLLEHKFVQGRFTERDIIEVVETDKKGRFALRFNENSSEIFIYINLEAALTSGLKFFCSANGVILCPGNQKGFIEPIFFEKVCRSDGSLLKL